ncbi:Uncharacterised protein [uncultured archaeon]|nr:Uncharacterised protein [uncultured archaeon]
MKVTAQQAREFLEEIKSEDRVAIFTHKDLDGFAAGGLFYNFCEKKKCKKIQVFIINYGERKISDCSLDEFNVILISDLAPSSVAEDLVKLDDKKILYTDHHPEEKEYPIPEFVLELRMNFQGYIPSSRTCFEITEKENANLKWLGVFGTISDMGQLYKENDEFLGKYYQENNTNFEKTYSFVKLLNNVILFFSASTEAFYKIASLSKVSDIKKLKEYYEPVEEEWTKLEKQFKEKRENFGKIVYFYFEPKYSLLKSPFISGLSGNEPGKVYIFAVPKRGNLIGISGRNQSREYSVLKIMQGCLSGLKDGSAAGHIAAVGGQVDKSDLETFKENLRNYDVEKARMNG